MSKVIFIKWIIQLTFDKACKTLIYFENQRNSTCISFDYQQFLMFFCIPAGWRVIMIKVVFSSSPDLSDPLSKMELKCFHAMEGNSEINRFSKKVNNTDHI